MQGLGDCQFSNNCCCMRSHSTHLPPAPRCTALISVIHEAGLDHPSLHPCPHPLAAWLRLLPTPHATQCSPLLPASLLSLQQLSTQPSLHSTRAPFLQVYNGYNRHTAFLQDSKLTCPFCEKCRLRWRQSSAECLPKLAHHFWTFSGSGSLLPQQLCLGEKGRVVPLARHQLLMHRSSLLQQWTASTPRDIEILPDA